MRTNPAARGVRAGGGGEAGLLVMTGEAFPPDPCSPTDDGCRSEPSIQGDLRLIPAGGGPDFQAGFVITPCAV